MSIQNYIFSIVKFWFEYVLWGLFLAAMLISFSSDALLLFMVSDGLDATASIIFATLGNWIGEMSSY